MAIQYQNTKSIDIVPIYPCNYPIAYHKTSQSWNWWTQSRSVRRKHNLPTSPFCPNLPIFLPPFYTCHLYPSSISWHFSVYHWCVKIFWHSHNTKNWNPNSVLIVSQLEIINIVHLYFPLCQVSKNLRYFQIYPISQSLYYPLWLCISS